MIVISRRSLESEGVQETAGARSTGDEQHVNRNRRRSPFYRPGEQRRNGWQSNWRPEKNRKVSVLVGLRLAGGRLVGLASGIDGRAHPGALVSDDRLAPLHELFPLSSPAINGVAAAIDVFTHLLLALVHN